MSRKQVLFCDTCGKTIKPGGSDAMLYGPPDTRQHFDGLVELDICLACCVVLDEARRLGVIEIPWFPNPRNFGKED